MSAPAVAALRSFGAQVRADSLVRNSFFLMATTALGAASGFVFWLLVARLYPVEQVGQATSLLSAVTLLSYFSLLGMSSSLVRHLPTTRHRAEHVGTALTTVVLTGVLVAAGFLLLLPWIAPKLSFVRASPVQIGVFVVLATGAALNLLTDSVFVALRAAKYNLLINGVLMSAVKLVFPVLLVATGAIGIFVASGVASTVAAVVSVIAIRRRLHLRLRPGISAAVLRETVGYSLGSYVSSCLNLVPLLVIPLLLLEKLGAVAAATYFVAFQIANLINAGAFAVGEALFAEGSHEDGRFGHLTRRSAVVTLAVVTPAVAVVVLLAQPVLAVFGSRYAVDGRDTLIVLALSAFPVAFNTWTSFLLKITRQLVALTVSNVVYAAGTVLLVVVGVAHGPVWVAAAWGGGNLLSGVAAAIALVARRRARPPATADAAPVGSSA